MRSDLLRRVAKLEAQLAFSARSLRRLAERMQTDPERLLQATKGHEGQLAGQLGEDGTITWEGYRLLMKLLGIDPTQRPIRLDRADATVATGRKPNAKMTRVNAKNNASLTQPQASPRRADSA